MPKLELFPDEQVVGVFRGFCEGGLEFHADLVLPYRNEFQNIPMHGQFLLVQLETTEEGVLGRITSFSSEGKLSYGSGEEFNIRAVKENRPIPEDLREQYLKYKVNIRVLGVIRNNGMDKLTFVPSHRRLPHVGSPVAFPSGEVLREIAGHNIVGAEIGHFALGEYIYAQGADDFGVSEWMQLKSPEIRVKFPINSLVSRRSFVFSKAGFGKSNLAKLLFSKLYEDTPTVEKRNNTKVPVGTVIFDPDGEYFWPDDKGRPGLCDVPSLIDKLVVFTNRRSPSPFYQSFAAGGILLDIRRLRPSDVIAIALGPERQDQQNVRKLRGLDQGNWARLVDEIYKNGNQADLKEISKLVGLDETQQQAEALAARANMTVIVRMLHDPGSQLMDMLLTALSQGKLCVVDVSQMRGAQSMILAGLILRRIFDRNQQEFTAAEPRTIPVIAVIEEAQAVLKENATASEPYISWVKEGRKYDLGAMLITQQPGSISTEILSQGDNWFIFHLLSASDLTTLKKANAHFSEDLLSTLLNEPIPGQGVFWSSVGGKPYPVSIRVLLFEDMFKAIDLNYEKPAVNTFAKQIRSTFESELQQGIGQIKSDQSVKPRESDIGDTETPDILRSYEEKMIDALKRDADIMVKLKSKDGLPWGALNVFFKGLLPETFDDKEGFAYRFVPQAMNKIFGKQDEDWHTYKHPVKGKTYIKLGRA